MPIADQAAGELEKRLGPRRRVFLAGKALLANGRVVDVIFRDISARGARLLLPGSSALTGAVAVLLLREALVLRARVIWSQPPMFGVALDEAIDVSRSCPIAYTPLADSWRAWKMAS